MLRVLVVDDEVLVRERVKHCLDWQEMGFSIEAEAADGQEALDLMDSVRPHFVITDITMPYINGLDFSRIVKERYPQCIIVILTGYDDFDYARTAIHIGVHSFLLKPIDQRELREVALAIKEKIEMQTQLTQRLQSARSDARMLNAVKREKLFAAMVLNEKPVPEAQTSESFLACFPKLSDGPFQLFLMDYRLEEQAGFSPKEYDLMRFAIENIVSEVLEPLAQAELTGDARHRLALVAGIADKGAEEYCLRAQQYVKRHLGVVLTIGASLPQESLAGLAEAWQQAGTALDNTVIWGRGSLIPYEKIGYGSVSMWTNRRVRDELLIHVRLGNMQGIETLIHAFFQEVAEKKQSVDVLTIALADILYVAGLLAKEHDVSLSEVTETHISVETFITARESLAQVESVMMELLYRLARFHAGGNRLPYAGLVGRAKRFIDENHTNANINLDIIAGNLGVNASHLSNVFKKELGESIIEYLTRCRMENGKKLLDEGKATLTEIAEAIGFNDPYYFSKCFKKAYGISPSQYMKK